MKKFVTVQLVVFALLLLCITAAWWHSTFSISVCSGAFLPGQHQGILVFIKDNNPIVDFEITGKSRGGGGNIVDIDPEGNAVLLIDTETEEMTVFSFPNKMSLYAFDTNQWQVSDRIVSSDATVWTLMRGPHTFFTQTYQGVGRMANQTNRMHIGVKIK